MGEKKCGKRTRRPIEATGHCSGEVPILFTVPVSWMRSSVVFPRSFRPVEVGIFTVFLLFASTIASPAADFLRADDRLSTKTLQTVDPPGMVPDSFRVQLFATKDEEAATSFRSEVRRWWWRARSQAPSGVFRTTPPLIIEHVDPYYRVHIGTFSTSDQAKRAKNFLQREYPEAFVVQDAFPGPPSSDSTVEDSSSQDKAKSDRLFRVQLFATEERSAAESFREEVRQWWAETKERAAGVFGAHPPVTIGYDGTYHQVRFGEFPTRSEALWGRAFLRRQYPDAIVVRTSRKQTNPRQEPVASHQADSMTVGGENRPATQFDRKSTEQTDPSGSGRVDSLGIDVEAAWSQIQAATELVKRQSRDSVYSEKALVDIFTLNCSHPRPEYARSEALTREASHLDQNIGLEFEARYGQETGPVLGENAGGGLSGTYVGLDWDLLSQGFYGNRKRSNLLQARARTERLTGRLAQIQRTETCRARQVQERFRGMLPRLLEAKIKVGGYRTRLLRRAYLDGDVLLDTYLEAKGDTEEARRRLDTYRGMAQRRDIPDPLRTYPPLLGFKFDSLSQAGYGDSLRRELGRIERKAVSLQDEAAFDTRLSVFGRYTTTRTFDNRDFEFGVRLTQPVFGALFGNDEVAETERIELRRREEALALAEHRENLRTVERRFEEDQARALRAHYRTVGRRDRVRRQLSERSIDGNYRLIDALESTENLLNAAIEKALAYGEVYEEVARAFSAAREPFDADYLTRHPVTSYEQRGRVGQRSLYVWSEQFRTRSNTFLIELARARKIGRLIVSVGKDTPMKKLRRLQGEAPTNDLTVELLLAPNYWLRPGGVKEAKARLDTLDLQGSPLHLDLEPHMFEDFEQRENELLQRYVKVLRVARRAVGDNELVVSVPLFWPDQVYKEIAKIVDRVHLMAYGTKQTHERARQVRAVARHFAPEQQVIALRPDDFASPSALNQAISVLQETVGTKRYALHDLESFLHFTSDTP